MPEGSGWDWNVLAWDGGRFRLAEGAGITSHHDLEPTFTKPAFVCRAADFEDPVFRTVTSEELPALSHRFGGCPPVVVAFEADAGGVDPVTSAPACQQLSIVREEGFVCVFSDEALPREWNVDRPGRQAVGSSSTTTPYASNPTYKKSSH
ncbi:hypothetical protein [Streptomyces sp. NPDC048428]|uniref:hypothetical protein n=1 Tax=Streptomyces sp. NPDC048428 TaxID=3154503 RepID=UPI0034267A16